MAIFTEAYCMQLMHETSQNVISELLEEDNNSFINFELSPIKVQRICEECKNYHLSISESYLLEASGPKISDLRKLGIKNAEGKVNKTAADITSIIKKNGITSESKKHIHNIISDLFQDIADSIDNTVVATNPKLKNIENQRNTTNALVLLTWYLIIGNLISTVLCNLMGAVGSILVIVVVAPVMEEACKAIAVKGGFDKEYNLAFNAFEFTKYVSKGAPVISRLVVVGMHTLTTAINKLFSTEEFRKKFGISDDKDAKDKCTFAAYIIGLFIHTSWNSAALYRAFKIVNSI